MAKVRVDLDYVIYNGSPVTFNAPCDCTAADGLIIYHPEGYQSFTFCDAHGENLSGIGDVFVAGVPVKVILDTENSRAFVQNGDNNTHLNSILSSLLDRVGELELGAVSESGSYVGTGKSWHDYVDLDGDGSYERFFNTLTFSFVPRLVIIDVPNMRPFAPVVIVRGASYFSVLDTDSATAMVTPDLRTNTVSWNDKTITWSYQQTVSGDTDSEKDRYQLNALGATYEYIAFA